MMNGQINFYGTSTIGEKGQIVIPAKAREMLNIKSGDDFIFFGHSHGHGPGVINVIKASEINGMLERMSRFSEGFSDFKAGIEKSIKKNK